MMSADFFKKLVLTSILILFLILSDKYLFNGRPHNFILSALSRPLTAVNEKIVQVSRYSKAFFDYSGVVGENKELRKKNAELTGQNSELETLKRENIVLRKQLGVTGRAEKKVIMAEIEAVNRNIVSTIIINKGSADGIKKGMVVVVGGNILVGTIDAVYPDNSSVVLADDPRSTISVRIGASSVIGSARGAQNGLGMVTIDFVTNKDKVNRGDMIVTSGLDNLPEGLPIASIDSVNLKGGSLFKEVKGKLIFNLSSGPNVFIIQ